jgi:WD and tetratricopeptide repeat-containing protein 1
MANIFCVKFLPETSDEQIITCAGDHRIKLFRLDYNNPENSKVNDYKCHRGRVKKLATESGNPNLFWSASEDGTVRQFDTRLKHICRRDAPCDTVLVNLQGKNSPLEIYR